MRPKTGEILAMVSLPNYDPGKSADFLFAFDSEGDRYLVDRIGRAKHPDVRIFNRCSCFSLLRKDSHQHEASIVDVSRNFLNDPVSESCVQLSEKVVIRLATELVKLE